MKSAVFMLVAVGWLLGDAGHIGADQKPLRLAVELTDGSRVIGVSLNESVAIMTEFGKVQVSLKIVDSVRWKADREHVVLEFANGDRLTGTINPDVLQLRTLFGDARISLEHVTMLKTAPAELSSLPDLDGLVLYFPFDEQPQAGAIPSRVGHFVGKQQGGQWIREGQRGGAFQFSKPDDCIVVADHEILRPKKLTVAAWVNPDTITSSSTWRGIITKATSGSWTGGFGLARYPSDPNVHFFVNYYSTATAESPIPDNAWTHVVATYDEQLLTLFVNGAKVSVVTPQSDYGGPIQHGNSPLLVGQGPNGYGWFGKIDEVMIFNRVLSADEIGRLYQVTRGD